MHFEWGLDWKDQMGKRPEGVVREYILGQTVKTKNHAYIHMKAI